ncbi:unnamed protein product [Owenia fusiformis]|uniref:Bleomycin hydrolase n=1 Tax=Owenia fusiformis TaxID=6347 RepID=A0A8J1YBH7_OWEFU|nr:unnamed protein product [Owenia fusiformis]
MIRQFAYKMAGIPTETIAAFKAKFDADPKNHLAQNVCSRQDMLDVVLKRDVINGPHHVYTHKIKTEGKPVTNQKSSGRCWIFACMNAIRIAFCKEKNIEDFEFSQGHLFFWDKIERSNYILSALTEILKKGEKVDGRLISHLLHNPSEDGGQWDMLVNLVEKYGLMPKKCWPDVYSCEKSMRLGRLINNKIREFCYKLKKAVDEGSTDDQLTTLRETMMEEMYRIISISVGSPPETIIWEYYDKDKKYQKVGPITPLAFYQEHIKQNVFNMEDKIVLTNDPRPQNPFNKLYTVEYLNNMMGARPVLYVNQPVDVLKKCAAESIKNDEAVWFGTDVGKCFNGKLGFNDTEMYDYDLVFGTTVLGLNKSDRLIYGESLMTHAMLLTGVSINEDETTSKWRVENSWGEDHGEKGYIQMTDKFFSEFVYEVVVDKKYVPDDVQAIMKTTPVVLPAWDPMGALAHTAKL